MPVDLEGPDNPGPHHPDNLQFRLKAHNTKKNNRNWPRFSLEQQVDYIKAVVAVQETVAEQLEISISYPVLDALIERLSKVYESK